MTKRYTLMGILPQDFSGASIVFSNGECVTVKSVSSGHDYHGDLFDVTFQRSFKIKGIEKHKNDVCHVHTFYWDGWPLDCSVYQTTSHEKLRRNCVYPVKIIFPDRSEYIVEEKSMIHFRDIDTTTEMLDWASSSRDTADSP